VDQKKHGRCKGVIVNMITKHKEPRLERIPVTPSPDHLQDFERLMATLPPRMEVYEKMHWPKSLSHCAGYARGYGRCQYYSLCHDHPTTEPAQWGSTYDLPEEFTKNAIESD